MPEIVADNNMEDTGAEVLPNPGNGGFAEQDGLKHLDPVKEAEHMGVNLNPVGGHGQGGEGH